MEITCYIKHITNLLEFSDSIFKYSEKSVISKPYAINCFAPIKVSETLLQHS